MIGQKTAIAVSFLAMVGLICLVVQPRHPDGMASRANSSALVEFYGEVGLQYTVYGHAGLSVHMLKPVSAGHAGVGTRAWNLKPPPQSLCPDCRHMVLDVLAPLYENGVAQLMHLK